MATKRKIRPLRERFGKRLRSLRIAAGLTQEQLAEKSDISVDFLSLIERGRNSPSFDNLDSLASALQLPASDLFIFEEDGK
ncbi:MAG TPA: helix-turn-helix transcriptional regulator [Candidatus Angelobacter sp.]|nr:helix-turn-helix transcriptional regulator [Candidatus Angelobacter sp.]